MGVVTGSGGTVAAEAAGTDAYPLPPQFTTWSGCLQLAMKRVVDVVGAGLGILVLAPVLAAIALLVWVDSGRPIFFQWRVVGLRGRRFVGYKFRTMIPGAEAMQAALGSDNEMSGPVFKMRCDPRVTRIGRLLRRFSLDELPQLWSVLRGGLTLVGPRPLRWHEFESLTRGQRARCAVMPGITCLWQVSGRSEINDFDEWMRLDLEYIRRWNIRLDLKILWRTVGAVLSRRGAY